MLNIMVVFKSCARLYLAAVRVVSNESSQQLDGALTHIDWFITKATNRELHNLSVPAQRQSLKDRIMSKRLSINTQAFLINKHTLLLTIRV